MNKGVKKSENYKKTRNIIASVKLGEMLEVCQRWRGGGRG